MSPPVRFAGPSSAAWLMVLATLLFAVMGVCVKQASTAVSTAEVVFVRGLVGTILITMLASWRRLPLRTSVPAQHWWRGVAGVSALSLWFHAIAHLPLATAVTLNYTSSVWMAAFLMLRSAWRTWRGHPPGAVPARLVIAVALGFAGVALVLRPTLERDQWLEGAIGLLSGMLSAWAYLQVAGLGRAGEPEHRVVFYFSVFGTVAGALASGALWVAGVQTWSAPSPIVWIWLLGIGVFATAAQLAMTRAYAQGTPLVMATLQYLGIAHALVLGTALFGEPLHLVSVAGTALIVLSGIAATRMNASVDR